jgi:Zn-dependent peptidase ImmA (M78 family)
MAEKLMAIMKEHNIALKFWDFHPPIEAVYYCYPGKNPVIGIDHKIKNERKHFRCVLAEELGHFFTTDHGSIVSYYQVRDRIGLCRQEYNALEWAVNFLLPDPEFEQAVLSMPPWELEEYFQVDSDFIAFKLKLKKEQLLQVIPGFFPNLPGESIPSR